MFRTRFTKPQDIIRIILRKKNWGVTVLGTAAGLT